jgi:hypothetical protein
LPVALEGSVGCICGGRGRDDTTSASGHDWLKRRCLARKWKAARCFASVTATWQAFRHVPLRTWSSAGPDAADEKEPCALYMGAAERGATSPCMPGGKGWCHMEVESELLDE